MIRTEVTRVAGFHVPEASQVRRIVQMVLHQEGRNDAVVSVVFTDDKESTALNKRFLRHAHVTDVLSFALETAPLLEAEIYINAEQARRQAKHNNVPMREEYARLVIHGVLHCCGYDDRRTKYRKLMFEKQEQYVSRASAIVKAKRRKK